MRRTPHWTAAAALTAAVTALAPAAAHLTAGSGSRALAQHATPVAARAEPGAIAGQYIVTLAKGTDAAGVARALGVHPLYTYGSALDGFAARLDAAQLARARARADVDEVEADTAVTIPQNEDAPSDADLDTGDQGDAGGGDTGPGTPDDGPDPHLPGELPAPGQAPAKAPAAHRHPAAGPAKPTEPTKSAEPSRTPAPRPSKSATPTAAPGSGTVTGVSGADSTGASAGAGSGPRLGGFTPWGLIRISHRTSGGTSFDVRSTGAGVTAYIVDSGIEYAHPDFGGRAVPGFDAIHDGRDGGDCNGHGTHVAGVVGGDYTGVARRVRLVSVRVFPCVARTTTSAVIAGIDWVAGHAAKPAVANISIAGPWSRAADLAVQGLADAGVFPVVAAGNDDVNACFVSPASSSEAFTVGSIDENDHRSWFSNWGPCVDLHAPGTSILSSYLNGTFRDMDGTAMAAPHVTGIAALYKATYGDASFAKLSKWLTGNATRNVPMDGGADTKRLCAYTDGL
jgi:subtilisin family serine protease